LRSQRKRPRIIARHGELSADPLALCGRNRDHEPAREHLQSGLDPHAYARDRDAGEDPMALETPENCAERIVDLCLPSYAETGTLYNYRVKKFLSWTPPA
jgi:hypothetical protein